jgi:hypothetical protein
MFASRAIWHVVDEVQISIVRDRDLHLIDRELVSRATGDFWATIRFGDRTLYAFILMIG